MMPGKAASAKMRLLACCLDCRHPEPDPAEVAEHSMLSVLFR